MTYCIVVWNCKHWNHRKEFIVDCSDGLTMTAKICVYMWILDHENSLKNN
jgi:hypothetical protein